jgi:predicted DsbA family dithiol-disulfide isomerase
MLEVFADIACPFTYVGLRRLLTERERLGLEVSIRVLPWPLEIINGTPLDPDFVATEVDALRRQVAPDLFAGFDPRTFPKTTLPAMSVAEAAYRLGTETGEATSLALREALFDHGRDVSRPDVLDEITKAFELPHPTEADRQAVLDGYEEGKRRGVVGSPHFFAGSIDEFCPALRIAHEHGTFEVSATLERLDRLIRAAAA